MLGICGSTTETSAGTVSGSLRGGVLATSGTKKERASLPAQTKAFNIDFDEVILALDRAKNLFIISPRKILEK